MSICSIAALLQQNHTLDNAMSGCRYYQQSDESYIQTDVRLSLEERLALSERLKDSVSDNKSKIISPSDDKACADCHRNGIELLVCSNCGNYTCGDCAVETFDGRTLCEKCYDEAPPTPI